MRLIITADWHLRDDKPRCRKDDNWYFIQNETMKEIISIANKKKASMAIVGDIFDTPTISTGLFISFLGNILNTLNKDLFLIFGNHDLSYHNIKNITDSTSGILYELMNNDPEFKIKFPRYMDASYAHFNDEIINPEKEILFLHRLVFKTPKEMPPNVNATTAGELLKEYPGYKWIFTGDMHKSFHYENNGRHVINPGCIIRQEADFIDYKPSIFFVDTESELVEQIYLHDDEEMVTDEYLKQEKEKEDRIDAFVEMIKTGTGFSLNFIDNIRKSIKKNKKNLDDITIETIEELVGLEEGKES